jgi:hypothetical protein
MHATLLSGMLSVNCIVDNKCKRHDQGENISVRPNLKCVYIQNARMLIFVVCLAVNGGFDSARTQREGMGLLE